MKWTKRVLFFIGLICLCDDAGLAQAAASGAVPAGTASVSGRVLLQGKPLARVHLGLQRGSTGFTTLTNAVRSETDAEGRYKFSGLTAGSYSINPLSSVYIWADGTPEAASNITLDDGEQATDVDISLKLGGVVTGKVVDADGNPVVARFVQIDRADGPYRGMPPLGVLTFVDFSTDDRGIYRYYGVPPGKYRVSCGDGEGSFRQGSPGKTFPRTFHPDVAEQAMATIIEVGEGSETTGVDIRLGRATTTYSITGRVVDADTNQPVGGISITLMMTAADGRSQQFGGRATAASSGDFVLTSVRPGRWRISAESSFPSPSIGVGGYSDPIDVEVRDENVTGVEIRVRRGGSITGVAVIESGGSTPSSPRLSEQRVMVVVRPDGNAPMSPSPLRQVQITDEGSFRVDGLRAGRVSFLQASMPGTVGLKLVRTERNGQLAPPEGIEVGAAENLTGVRLVFGYATAKIVGQVVVTGGALPPGITLWAFARPLGGGFASGGSARPDARGNFAIEGLVPGEYEINVQANSMQNPQQAGASGTGVKQNISLAHGETAKVTLTFAVKAP
jgi:protocatechuate 3,4-dioxygenase beta subunit